jgi:hypothetical protein
MTDDPGSSVQAAAEPARSRKRWIVLVVGLVVTAGAIAWSAWPRPVCSDDERSALLAVPAFGDATPPVVDSGPETQPSTAGCAMAFEADAAAEEVADYYADRLEGLGWSGGGVETIEGDPLRYLVGRDLADLAEHPDWEDLHLGVMVTVLSAERSKVDVSVRKYVVTVY